jgi:hypothetical protein
MMAEFVSGKLVSGGGLCESCGRRLEEGEKVYALAGEVDDIKEYLYCQGCQPGDDELPEGVQCIEPALAVEEPGEEERRMGIEVKAGSTCSRCGHIFDEEEWLFVGVVEGLCRGFVYCQECCMSQQELEE